MHSSHPLFRRPLLTIATSIVSVNLLCGFSIFHKKKYETPITKDTMQPDKVLFDRAINNIEHGNYLAARLTLNTLINTYDTSEYLAKAKLAIADSWFREGDAHGLAQAEIEYKDFILFYPQMEEAAESQYKVCEIHYKQMSKPDRDSAEAQRAEDECRQSLIQFPNSKYYKLAEQKLREVQEMLADKEFKTGLYYYQKGSLPAAEGRFSFVTRQYPLYSGSDEALWDQADAFRKMGDRFENQEADALTKIVRDYPVSIHVAAAKNRLTEMKRPVPEADAEAYKRMKYNMEHVTHEGILANALSIITGKPDVGAAAKQGAPIMTSLKPLAPVSVPQEAAGSVAAGTGSTGVSDVGIGVVGSSTALDQKSDARLSASAGTEGEHKASVDSNGLTTGASGAAASTTASTAAAQAPLPTNHPYTKKQLDELKKQQDDAAKRLKKAQDAAAKQAAKNPAKAAAAGATPGVTTPDGKPATSATPATNVPAAAQQ